MDELLDLVQPGLDRGPVHQRLRQPRPEHPPAHRREGLVDHTEQRSLKSTLPQRLGQLEVAPRGGVQHQEGIGGVGAQPGQLRQRTPLRLAQIRHDRAGGAHSQWHSLAAESLQGRHLEVVQQHLTGCAQLEAIARKRRDVRNLRPSIGTAGHRTAWPVVRPTRLAFPLRNQALPGLKASQLARDLPARHLRHGKLARGDVGMGQPGPVSIHDQGSQVAGALRFQQRRLHHRTRRDHTGHLAVDETAPRDLSHLLGDGHPIALLHQAGDVAIDRVMGHARHRHAHPLGHRA